MSLTVLAKLIDGLYSAGQAVVVENDARVSVSGVTRANALKVVGALEDLDWQFEIFDVHGNEWLPGEMEQQFEPFRFDIVKPVPDQGVVRLLTNSAFSRWLEEQRPFSRLQVARLGQSFRTQSGSFGPWDYVPHSDIQPESKDPRQLCREIGGVSLVPADIRPWLLADGQTTAMSCAAFQVWANASSKFLMRALSDELDRETHGLKFRGPPRIALDAPQTDTLAVLDSDGFDDLQQAANWVFELKREAEHRHHLFSAEFARASLGRTNAVVAFKEAARGALESAKIAYQLGLSELSRDTLKALADLRKAVTEEVAKVSDTTRQIVGGVAGALGVGLGLIGARLASNVDPHLLNVLAVVVAGYVAAISVSGWSYLSIQKSVRQSWRARLYSFLTPSEYQEMVSEPLAKATVSFHAVALLGLALTGVMVFAVITAHPAANPTATGNRSIGDRNSIASPAAKPADAPVAAPITKTGQAEHPTLTSKEKVGGLKR